jgi:hypothetical protein
LLRLRKLQKIRGYPKVCVNLLNGIKYHLGGFIMPRYKLTEEERARKEQIRGIISGMEIKDFKDIQALFKEMVGEVLQAGLEGELEDELGEYSGVL